MTAIRAYRDRSLSTAPPEKIVLMLFEALVRRLEQAAAKLERSESAVEDLYVSREIFAELRSALDRNAAPELATRLDRLYGWCMVELSGAGMARDAARVLDVHRLAVTLRDSWQKVVAVVAS